MVTSLLLGSARLKSSMRLCRKQPKVSSSAQDSTFPGLCRQRPNTREGRSRPCLSMGLDQGHTSFLLCCSRKKRRSWSINRKELFPASSFRNSSHLDSWKYQNKGEKLKGLSESWESLSQAPDSPHTGSQSPSHTSVISQIDFTMKSQKQRDLESLSRPIALPGLSPDTGLEVPRLSGNLVKGVT